MVFRRREGFFFRGLALWQDWSIWSRKPRYRTLQAIMLSPHTFRDSVSVVLRLSDGWVDSCVRKGCFRCVEGILVKKVNTGRNGPSEASYFMPREASPAMSMERADPELYGGILIMHRFPSQLALDYVLWVIARGFAIY
ncbi:hypothetical protein C8J56DRAFT_891160 [Mycena floridula]|nr:hypothetical protein C8J56DRAFT_891160 [Mycena floridula]